MTSCRHEPPLLSNRFNSRSRPLVSPFGQIHQVRYIRPYSQFGVSVSLKKASFVTCGASAHKFFFDPITVDFPSFHFWVIAIDDSVPVLCEPCLGMSFYLQQTATCLTPGGLCRYLFILFILTGLSYCIFRSCGPFLFSTALGSGICEHVTTYFG